MLKKENIYIDLRGKSKEELTDLYWLLKNNNQNLLHNDLSVFIEEYYKTKRFLEYYNKRWGGGGNSKTEVTIQQLKEILQPMGTFTPIAMKCTQEQFEAIKPKLVFGFNCWKNYDKDLNYLYNNIDGIKNRIGLLQECFKYKNNRTVHETWNEEIFLKACGIEVETLEQQLEKAKEEVVRLKEAIEESQIKVGDWYFEISNKVIRRAQNKMTKEHLFSNYNSIKITDQGLINKLNELIK